jgi:ribose 1,5-bisphosphokinase PhnN
MSSAHSVALMLLHKAADYTVCVDASRSVHAEARGVFADLLIVSIIVQHCVVAILDRHSC